MAWSVRFIAGNVAGLCTFVMLLVYSIEWDKRPGLFLVLSLLIFVLVRYQRRFSLPVLHLVPVTAMCVLLWTGLSTAPVVGLFAADLIALIALAYRGWANKRLVD